MGGKAFHIPWCVEREEQTYRYNANTTSSSVAFNTELLHLYFIDVLSDVTFDL